MMVMIVVFRAPFFGVQVHEVGQRLIRRRRRRRPRRQLLVDVVVQQLPADLPPLASTADWQVKDRRSQYASNHAVLQFPLNEESGWQWRPSRFQKYQNQGLTLKRLNGEPSSVGSLQYGGGVLGSGACGLRYRPTTPTSGSTESPRREAEELLRSPGKQFLAGVSVIASLGSDIIVPGTGRRDQRRRPTTQLTILALPLAL
ncbi:hypothetical protein THAOC_15680 [Thalassiosira oceanica]|uniref:Uncharacterized protein n=1 Tax=Thalassiosira oceanica TaxID=159749 RepID=K0SC36_THAOC|nr:hypothetical protein THAOC_15680 [Thalassiosira oceanica]|eukprot:EJK63648.1 hypothetical protein THAOC_15680 [Thalassiosira oceanica]